MCIHWSWLMHDATGISSAVLDRADRTAMMVLMLMSNTKLPVERDLPLNDTSTPTTATKQIELKAAAVTSQCQSQKLDWFGFRGESDRSLVVHGPCV
jgi:hypothetical protein